MPGGKGHAGEELSTGGGQPRRGQGHGLGSPPPAPQCCHKWELLVRLFPDFENTTYHLLDAKSRVSIVNPLGNMEMDQKEVDRGKKSTHHNGIPPTEGASCRRKGSFSAEMEPDWGGGGWWLVAGLCGAGRSTRRGRTFQGVHSGRRTAKECMNLRGEQHCEPLSDLLWVLSFPLRLPGS